MSLDYPDYLQIQEKSKPLAWLWAFGDISYYVGVLGAVILPLASVGGIVNLYFEGTAIPIGLYLLGPLGFVGCVLLSLAALWLKGVVRRRAKIR